MASTTPTSTPLSLSSSALLNAKAPSSPPRLQPTPVAAPSPLLLLQPTFPRPMPIVSRKIARNVVSMATGEAPAEVVATAETPEIIKTIQEAWDKVEDKYAVSSLAVAGGVALWASAGMISAIDRLPLVPGVLEIVGIGYTGRHGLQLRHRLLNLAARVLWDSWKVQSALIVVTQRREHHLELVERQQPPNALDQLHLPRWLPSSFDVKF
ncbi:protein CURVATURE THYLAKOID 1B, chloroplastic [Sesamum angolense]|uniref:Protein CURVATURE THYLAKOID 1B, chloroplastic n=1 Tax=Sesamum angolense TaxID=2727404 RepID=A0AAE1XGW6_9LAMI|nr:protein CURVATURE THYLAKOID 1B, chloroplastic [Sesamum angolense]